MCVFVCFGLLVSNVYVMKELVVSNVKIYLFRKQGKSVCSMWIDMFCGFDVLCIIVEYWMFA